MRGIGDNGTEGGVGRWIGGRGNVKAGAGPGAGRGCGGDGRGESGGGAPGEESGGLKGVVRNTVSGAPTAHRGGEVSGWNGGPWDQGGTADGVPRTGRGSDGYLRGDEDGAIEESPVDAGGVGHSP